jgi:hypothetical protein
MPSNLVFYLDLVFYLETLQRLSREQQREKENPVELLELCEFLLLEDADVSLVGFVFQLLKEKTDA